MIRVLMGAPIELRFRCYEIDFPSGAVLTCDSESLRVRVYSDVDDFLSEILRSRCPRYFAHEGGRYQVQPVLLAALDRELRCDGSFWGGVASRVTIHGADRSPQLLDSSGLIHGTLEEACQWAGIPLRATPSSRVLAVARLLREVRKILAALGANLRPTLAGAAFEIFRRVFLREDLETDSNLNKRTRKALYGGRVSPFRSGWDSGTGVKFTVDINSSYGAAALRGPIPGKLLKVDRRRAPNSISHVRVSVPPCYYPPLPYRSTETGGVYFPVGRWEGWYHESALTNAEAHGATVDEVFESLHFEPWEAPGNLAAALYDRRERSGSTLEKKVIKGIIQSVAGRLGMRSGYERLLCYPKEKVCPHDGEHQTPFGPSCFRPLRAGVYVVKDPEISASTAHVPASVAINAIALVALNDGVHTVLSNGGAIGYVDTDRIDATTVRGLSIGSGLGQWRIQREFFEAEYKSSKWLRVDEEITAAGLPGITRADWDLLVQGKDAERWDLSTVKEALQASHVYEAYRTWHLRRMCSECHQEISGEQCRNHPWAATTSAEGRPARIMYPNGETEPWDVEALAVPWRKIVSGGLPKR